jgi:drug/metabolite transporter (DMT)-like permease
MIGPCAVLVAVGAWFWLRERLGGRCHRIGVSLVGVVVLSLGDTGGTSAPNPVLGNLLELLAMVCSAGWMLVVRHLGDRYNPWLITGAQAGVGALFFLPGALASGPVTWAAATPAAWASVVYLGIFVTIGGFGLYNVALSMVPASRASLAVNLIPAVALLTGWIALGERLTPLQLVACVAIVGAVVYGENGRAKESAPTAVVPVDAAGE